MIRCELVGKDPSVCVRFFTHAAAPLKPWIDTFERGPCHVHSQAHVDSIKDGPSCEDELITWLGSSSALSALMLLDPRTSQISDPSLLNLCAKAKTHGVFIGIFVNGNKAAGVRTFQPNWVLSIQASPEEIQAKVNEILGVVRFSVFTKPFKEEIP